MRDTTERPEGCGCRDFEIGRNRRRKHLSNFKLLLEDQDEYEKMSQASNPYGDGNGLSTDCRNYYEGISIMKKVSIVIPVYNVEEYLQYSVGSLRQQTYSNIEIILVDDGSTDRSGEICDQYAQEDDRIRVLHLKMGTISSKKYQGSNRPLLIGSSF